MSDREIRRVLEFENKHLKAEVETVQGRLKDTLRAILSTQYSDDYDSFDKALSAIYLLCDRALLLSTDENNIKFQQVDVELQLAEILSQNGYTRLRWLSGRGWTGLQRFLYTWGVCYGLDESGYVGRICFDNPTSASGFINEWDGVDLPSIGEDGVTAHK